MEAELHFKVILAQVLEGDAELLKAAYVADGQGNYLLRHGVFSVEGWLDHLVANQLGDLDLASQ